MKDRRKPVPAGHALERSCPPVPGIESLFPFPHIIPEKKAFPAPTPSAGSARNARERRQKQQNSGGGNRALPGEQKNFQRLAHGTGKKLAMEKDVDQMRRIAPRYRKEKTPCPCCMAGVKAISQIFRVTPRQGERRSPAECSRKNIQIPGKLRPGRK